MKQPVPHTARSLLATAGILAATFVLSLMLQDVLGIPEQVTTLFVFAVFLVSLVTDGYQYGIAASLCSVLMVNYAFTFPYFKVNFIIRSNFISGVVMLVISVLTSTLTSKVRRQKQIRLETERERMRANLLRAVSHDLRTPLTTIYGASSALLEDSNALSDQQKMQMLANIRTDAQWLVRMVENLLSITRIGSGEVQIAKKPTVLDELVDAVIVNFKKRFPGRELEVDIPDEIVVIPMDPMLIEQVILNILENAIVHAEGMTRLRFAVRLQDGRAVFEIQDNGAGIQPGRLRNIFTGYYDAREAVPDGKKSNTGIGLSVCATIVRAHGGTIEAKNAPDGGALFRFTLNTENTEDLADE